MWVPRALYLLVAFASFIDCPSGRSSVHHTLRLNIVKGEKDTQNIRELAIEEKRIRRRVDLSVERGRISEARDMAGHSYTLPRGGLVVLVPMQ